MKNKIRIPLIIIITLICGSRLIAQNDIIITSTDTIRNVEILSLEMKTNAKKVSFLSESGDEISLTSQEVIRFYKENSLFKSKMVDYSNGQIEQEFVQLIINGDADLYFAKMKETNGNSEDNYLMSINDTIVVSLAPHKNNLDNFFSNYLPKYEEFKKTDSYSKLGEIKFRYSSLATFTSYYNSFINPDKFKATKYRKKSKAGYLIGIGVVAIITVVSIKVIGNAKDENDSRGIEP